MPIIALTFDDGPNTVITPQVLDLLEEHGILASFFLIAQNITPESAEVVRRAKAMGCDIENHTLTHPFMDKLSLEEIRKEVDTCTEKIVAITGSAARADCPVFPQSCNKPIACNDIDNICPCADIYFTESGTDVDTSAIITKADDIGTDGFHDFPNVIPLFQTS